MSILKEMNPRIQVSLAALTIAVAVIAMYHNTFSVPFLMDDLCTVVENWSIRHLWPLRDAVWPSPEGLLGGRPVVQFSFALNYAFGGLSPVGYHAVNLIIHVLAGLTLFGLVRRTLQRPILRERFGAHATPLALVAALLWGVHPLQTESVTYVLQRCESLMGLFYLLTLYAFLRGVESERGGKWLGVSVAACGLGMMSKELMVTAPAMVGLYDRVFVAGSFRQALRQRWGYYVGLGCGWLVLAGMMVGVHHRSVGYGLGVPWWKFAVNGGWMCWRYLRLAVWPHPLVFDYGSTEVLRSAGEVWPYTAVALVLMTGVMVALWRKPALGFAGAWFFVVLSPTTTVLPLVGQPFAEHRMYVPLAGVVVAAVGIGYRWLERRLAWASGLAVAVIIILGVRTWIRNQDYRSDKMLWEDVIRRCPDNSRAWLNLGSAFYQEGNMEEAIPFFVKAIAVNPSYGMAHNNLGCALTKLGRIHEAIPHLLQAIAWMPKNQWNVALAHSNLGACLLKEDRVEEAIPHLRQAIAFNPHNATAQNNLGNALLNQGNLEEAMPHLQQAVALNPMDALAQNNLGRAFLEKKQYAAALSPYELAIQRDSSLAAAHYGRGTVLLKLGQLSEATSALETALRLNPNLSLAHNNLGVVLHQQGKRNEAIEQFRQALAADPNNADARANLERVLAPPAANP